MLFVILFFFLLEFLKGQPQAAILYILCAASSLACLVCVIKLLPNQHFITKREFVFYGIVIIPVLLSCFSPYDNSLYVHSTVLLICSFWFFKYIFRWYKLEFLLPIVILGILLETIYGIVIYIKEGSILGLSGHFDNPAGYVALLNSTLPYFVLFLQKKYKPAGIFLWSVLFLSIIFSKSRAGIITAIIISFALYFPYFSRWYQLLTKTVRVGLITATSLLAIIVLGMLYLAKVDSANGRILIWTNCVAMIQDEPLMGHGANSFLSKYMYYQADFFEKEKDIKRVYLADNVRYPFNEYLGFIIQYGWIAFLIVIILVVIFFKGNSIRTLEQRMAYLSLLSIALLSLFSYPLYYSIILIIIALDISILISCDKKIIIRPATAYLVLIFILTGTLLLAFKAHKNFKLYNELNSLKESLISEKINSYQKLYEKGLCIDPYFCYNYAAILNENKLYSASLKLIKTSSMADSDHAILIANNYFNLSDYKEAEKYTDLAINMCPNRFIPLYYKFRILVETNRIEEARSIAREILEKSIKIESNDIIMIKLDLERFMIKESLK